MSNDLAVILNTALATEMGGPTFMALMQKISAYEVQVSNIKVTNDAEYQMCVDSLVLVAEAHKELEDMRKGIVAYPNTFVKTVNATFKGLKDRCIKTREKLSIPSTAYKVKKDAEHAKAVAAAQAAQVQAPAIEIGDEGEQVGQTGEQMPLPTPPLQTTKTVDGQGSVSYRKGPPEIEVVNAAKLVRAAISEKNKVPTAVVSIDAKALRAAVDSGVYTVKKWEGYGVKVTETQQQVVRG